jgi:hypothetical protein
MIRAEALTTIASTIALMASTSAARAESSSSTPELNEPVQITRGVRFTA